MILNGDVASQRRGISHDDVITENAVVPDMHVRHQKIMVPDSGAAAAAFRAAMEVDVFAKDIVIADGEKRVFAFELQVLRLQADGSKRIELIILPDRCRTFDDHVRFEAAPAADLHPASDAAKRPNVNISADVSFRADHRIRPNHGCWPIEAGRLASAASSDPT